MRLLRRFAMAALVLVMLAILFRNSGSFLVVDNRQKSDALVITQGDSLDTQYWAALKLLREGYGRELYLDARRNLALFGRSQADLAVDFIQRTAGNTPGRVRICPITADTTAKEVFEAANCLKASGARSVLLVVDDYHTRRSLATFSHLLPKYRWSITAVPDAAKFDAQWWRRREWIRTVVVEWQHLIWWEFLDRWRFVPAADAIPAAATGTGQGQ